MKISHDAHLVATADQEKWGDRLYPSDDEVVWSLDSVQWTPKNY